MMVLILLMTGFIVPFRVCFIDDSDDNDWYEVDVFFDSVFGLDMLVNFFSAFYDQHNRLRKTFKEISLHYLTGWFWIDMFAL